MSPHDQASGRLLKAPENVLDDQGVRRMVSEAKADRRDFVRKAFAAAVASAAAPAALAQANPVPAAGGDPRILELPAHSKGLGQPVAADGYGKPSKYETNVQRRPSPGLTQTSQSSVSFAPLQSLFGIVTPSGLHFERHHQGWWEVDFTLQGEPHVEPPRTARSQRQGVKRLMALVEKNPRALSAMFDVSEAVDASFSTRVKMGQSSKVYGVAMLGDGKVLFAQKEVKVTRGGCGG